MSLRVLIVEDDATIQRLLSTILSRKGIESAVVRDGKAAVDAWERGKFDVILMDVQMPILDGLAATRMIREKESIRGTRTVIIGTTAFAADADRDNCFKAGMDGYLTKPLDVEELLRLIERHRKMS